MDHNSSFHFEKLSHIRGGNKEMRYLEIIHKPVFNTCDGEVGILGGFCPSEDPFSGSAVDSFASDFCRFFLENVAKKDLRRATIPTLKVKAKRMNNI